MKTSTIMIPTVLVLALRMACTATTTVSSVVAVSACADDPEPDDAVDTCVEAYLQSLNDCPAPMELTMLSGAQKDSWDLYVAGGSHQITGGGSGEVGLSLPGMAGSCGIVCALPTTGCFANPEKNVCFSMDCACCGDMVNQCSGGTVNDEIGTGGEFQPTICECWSFAEEGVDSTGGADPFEDSTTSGMTGTTWDSTGGMTDDTTGGSTTALDSTGP